MSTQLYRFLACFPTMIPTPGIGSLCNGFFGPTSFRPEEVVGFSCSKVIGPWTWDEACVCGTLHASYACDCGEGAKRFRPPCFFLGGGRMYFWSDLITDSHSCCCWWWWWWWWWGWVLLLSLFFFFLFFFCMIDDFLLIFFPQNSWVARTCGYNVRNQFSRALANWELFWNASSVFNGPWTSPWVL